MLFSGGVEYRLLYQQPPPTTIHYMSTEEFLRGALEIKRLRLELEQLDELRQDTIIYTTQIDTSGNKTKEPKLIK